MEDGGVFEKRRKEGEEERPGEVLNHAPSAADFFYKQTFPVVEIYQDSISIHLRCCFLTLRSKSSGSDDPMAHSI